MRANIIEFHYFSSDFISLYIIRIAKLFFLLNSFVPITIETYCKSRACLGVRHISCKRNKKEAMASQLLTFRSRFPDFCVFLSVLEINITRETHCKASTVIFCSFDSLVIILVVV